jgi:hypothetical protein
MSLTEIQAYNDRQHPDDAAICTVLSDTIDAVP